MAGDSATLDELYREIILEHYRSPKRKRHLDTHNRHADGSNPLCGDQIRLEVELAGDRIADVGFQGKFLQIDYPDLGGDGQAEDRPPDPPRARGELPAAPALPIPQPAPVDPRGSSLYVLRSGSMFVIALVAGTALLAAGRPDPERSAA